MNDHQYNPSSMRSGRINNYGNSRSSNNAGPRGSMSGSSFTNQGKGSLLGSGPSNNSSFYKSNYSNRNSNANNQQYSSSKGQQNYPGNMSGNGSSMGYTSHNQLGYSGSSQQSFSGMNNTATSQQAYSSFSSSGNYEKSGMSGNRSNYSSNRSMFNDPFYKDTDNVPRHKDYSTNYTSQPSKDEEDLMNTYGLGQQDVRKMLSMTDKELESTYNNLQKRKFESGSMNYEQNDGYTSRSSGKSNYPEFNNRSRSDNAPPRSSSFKNDLGNSMYSNSNDESRPSQHSVSSGMRRSNFKSSGNSMASSQHGNTFDSNYDEFDNNYSRGRSSRRNSDLNLTNSNRSNQTRFNDDDNMRRSQRRDQLGSERRVERNVVRNQRNDDIDLPRRRDQNRRLNDNSILGAPPSQRSSNNETAALLAQVAGINNSQNGLLNNDTTKVLAQIQALKALQEETIKTTKMLAEAESFRMQSRNNNRGYRERSGRSNERRVVDRYDSRSSRQQENRSFRNRRDSSPPRRGRGQRRNFNNRTSSNVMVFDDYDHKAGNGSNKSITEKLNHDVKVMRESKGRVLFLRYKPLTNSRKSITEHDLTKISEKFGKVTRVVIIRPKFNGPMTHAFVELENPEHAANMLEAYLKNPPFISGVKILVDKSNYKEWKKDGSDVGKRFSGSRRKRSRSRSNPSKNQKSVKSRKTSGSKSPSNKKDNEGKSLSIKDRLGKKKTPKTNDMGKGSNASKKLDPKDLRNVLKNSEQTVNETDKTKEEEPVVQTNNEEANEKEAATVKEEDVEAKEDSSALVAAAPAEDLYDMTDDLLVHDEDFVMPMDEKTEKNENVELDADNSEGAEEALSNLSNDHKTHLDDTNAVETDVNESNSKQLETEDAVADGNSTADNPETVLEMDVDAEHRNEDETENYKNDQLEELEDVENKCKENENLNCSEDEEAEPKEIETKPKDEVEPKEIETKPKDEVEPVATVEAVQDDNKDKEVNQEEQSKSHDEISDTETKSQEVGGRRKSRRMKTK